ncbi:MAG: hypothetical protein NTX61_01230 [Bacteroidetes bacterium]|nr:hypothetical protein [Bacteroidota bacterium]
MNKVSKLKQLRKVILLFLSLIDATSYCQLTGIKTIPGNYATIAAAVADLNIQGVGAGGVTFNVAAGYTETLTSRLNLTATGTASNPIVFQKIGTGNNPKITAYVGLSTPGSLVPDGIWCLQGSDYVTINGIDLYDPNSSNPASMEYGYGLFKNSLTDGCQHNLIENCYITLNRVNNAAGTAPMVDGSVGILVINALPNAATIAITTTSGSGSNSYNHFYSNTVDNCNIGIALIGYADLDPFFLADQGNDVGGNSISTGNTIKNFGGAPNAANPAAGVQTMAQYGINISYNTVNNNDGNGVNHVNTLRGIYTNTDASPGETVTYNTITLKSAVTTANVSVIENAGGSDPLGNTINISNNTIQNCTNDLMSSGYWYGIYNNGATPSNLTINGNTFTGNSSKITLGYVYLIYNTGVVASAITMNNNNLSFSFPGELPFLGYFYGIANSSGTSSTTTTVNLNNNDFSNINFSTISTSSILNFIYNTNTSVYLNINNNTWTNLNLNHTSSEYLINNSSSTQIALNVNNNSISGTFTRTGAAGAMYCYYGRGFEYTSTQNITNNNFQGITASTAGTGAFYGMYIYNGTTSPYPKWTINGNTFNNINYNTTGGFYGIYPSYLGDGSTNSATVISNNTISNITCACDFYGIYPGSTSSPIFAPRIYDNSVFNISSSYAGTIYGIFLSAGGQGVYCYNNQVYGISGSNASSLVYGIYAATAGYPYYINNNFITDIKAPAATGANAVVGLYINASTGNIYAYYDTIYMNATSSGTGFGSSGIYAATGSTLDMRNNIVVNVSTPTGSGFTVAYRRSSTALTSYSNLSDNNLFYVGALPVSPYFTFYDGSASKTTLALYQDFVAPRDAHAITELPPFMNFSTTPYNLHINPAVATRCESGGQPVTSPVSVPTDIDGDTRSLSFPDIGADEFSGLITDVVSPIIVYTPLTNTSSTSARTLTATITDPSGVPTSGPALPVLYWKIGAGSYSAATTTSLGSGQYQFSFGSGVVATNTVSYYICAQDNAGTPNVGSYPPGGASGFTASPPACSTLPSSPSSYTIIANGLSGTINVGTGQTYTTLTGASGLFAAINAGVVKGNITAIITSNITETGANQLNQWIEEPMGSNYILTIQPDGTTERVLSGSYAGGLITLNGADRVTFDGHYSGGGRYLRFRNTNGSNPDILLQNDATNNTIQYCYLEAYNTTTGGVVSFSTSTGTLGNSSNTISHCIIRNRTDGTYAIACGIYSSGTATTLNANNTISDNEILNFTTYGVDITSIGNGGNWNISGNSFYNNLGTAPSAAQYSIYFVPGSLSNGNTISGNYIGGQSANCGGSAWTNSGAVIFDAIYYTGGWSTSSTISNNTIQNITLSSTSSATFNGIYVTSGAVNITGNTIGNPSLSNWITYAGMGNANYLIFLSCAMSPSSSVQGNTITGLTFTRTNNDMTSFIGIVHLFGMANIGTITGNVVGSTSTPNAILYAGAGNITGIYSCSSIGPNNLDNNVIANITFTGSSGSPGFFGIKTFYDNLHKNQIYNIGSNTTSLTPSITGIYSSGPALTTVEYVNNVISLNGGSALAPIIYGIYDNSSAQNSYNLYYNSVNITGNSSYSTTVDFYRLSTAYYTLKNNLFINNRPYPGPGIGNSISSDAGILVSDYNDLYSHTGYTATYYGVADFTLADWQDDTGQDPHSISADPLFISSTDLRLNFGSPAVRTAIPIPGYTTDFLGNTRSGTTPTPGAYENAVDVSGPVISYTPVPNTTSNSSQTLTAIITDYTGVPTTGLGLPVLYWKNTGSYTGVTGTWISGSQYQFTIPGAIAGTTIYYYICAQDNDSPTPLASCYPSTGAGTLTTNPPATGTPPATPSSYTVYSGYCGTYHVGVGKDYATITAAVAAINANVLTCPVVLLLDDAAYSSETFPITINPNSGSSPTNTITIQPNTGTSSVITGSFSGPIFRILNSNTFINGSNTGGTSRNLMITNTSVTKPNVILIGSIRTTPIVYSGVSNSILINGTQTSTAVVVSDGTYLGRAGYFNNISVQNNSIQLADTGVSCIGIPVTGNGSGLHVTGNDLNTPGTNSIRRIGVYFQGIDGGTISNNNIGNISSALSVHPIYLATSTVNTTVSGNTISSVTTSSTFMDGIFVYSNVTNSNISITGNTITGLTCAGYGSADAITILGNTGNITVQKNIINNIRNTYYFGAFVSGIDLQSTSQTANISIYNNILYDIGVSNANSRGIYIKGGGGYNVDYNSVRLSSDQTLASSACIYVSEVTAPSSIDLRNNIFYLDASIITNGLAIFCSSAPNVFSNINNNDYYSSGTNFGYINGATISTLAAWKAATGQDANSINANPIYSGVSDLRLDLASPCLGTGTPLTLVTTDYLGTTRSLTTPSIGAYEAGVDVSGPVIIYTLLPNTTSTSSVNLTATITDYTSVPTAGSGLPVLYWRIGASGGFTSATATSLGSNQYQLTIPGATAGCTVQYYICAQDNDATPMVSCSPSAGAAGFTNNPPAAPTPPTTPNSYTVYATLSSTVTVGTGGNYPSLTGSGGLFAAINSGMLSNNVQATIISDLTENGTNALNAWLESPTGGNYTLTIIPDGTTLRTIAGTAVATGTAKIRITGASRVTIDGSGGAGGGRYLLFRNTNSTTANTGPTFFFSGGASNDNLKYCFIENNGTTTTYGDIVLSGSTNSNIVISDNYIRDAQGGTTGRPYNAVYATSTVGAFTLSNNNIYNFSNYGAYLSSVSDCCTISGNSFYYNSSIPATVTQYAIYIGAGNNHSITGNYIGGQTPSCGGGAWTNSGTSSVNFYGMYLNVGSTTPASVQNNTIQNITMSGTSNTGIFTGIFINQGAVNVGTVSGNLIGHPTISGSITLAGTGNSRGIYAASSTTTNNFENNTVANILYTQTSGSPNIYGLYLYAGNARKNRIISLGASNSGLTPTIYGINNASTGTPEISNNLVSIVGGSATNPVLYGIYENTSGCSLFYFNSVNISGPATGTSNTYTFYRSSTSPDILKNNIFSNNRASGGTGKHYSVYSGNTTSWTSSYNDLYSAAGPLGYWTSDQDAITTWTTASNGDANSVSVDPQFISSTDLHPSSSELDGAGIAVSGITTDYTGILRGNPPDIGAYEFSPSPKTWNGSLSTDWNNPLNWTPNGVPTSGVSVTIPSGTPNPCIVGNNGMVCNDLTLNGTTFTINNSMVITVYGNLTFMNNATLVNMGSLTVNGHIIK